MLAHHKNWPQHWVDAADPSYIADLLTFMAAHSDYEAAEAELDPKVREARVKVRRIKRKVALAKRNQRGDSQS